MSESRYFLRSHAFLCDTGRHWIMLDLQRDKYLCIHERDFDLLWPWLHSCRNQTGRSLPNALTPSVETSRLASELIEQGLLSDRPDDAKPDTPAPIPSATAVLHAASSHPPAVQYSLYTPAFFYAAAKADYSLRRHSLQHTVNRVAARKRQRRSASKAFDLARASQLVSIFDTLRLFYPRPYLCMFDSLALLEFLALYSLFPSWIYGVTTEPFLAHCWVQEEAMLLNDTLPRVAMYTPIMSV